MSVVLCLAIVGLAGAQVQQAISISDLTPADGSTIPIGQPMLVSGFIATDSAIALVNGEPDVTVLVDGSAVNAEFVVGSRAVRVGFRANQTFAAGSHTLRVTARNVNGETADAQSTFTAAANATVTATTATAAPATAPTTVAAVKPTTTPVATAASAGLTATSTATRAAAPSVLPATGDFPLGDAIPAALAFGWTLTLFGLAMRRR